MNDLVHKYVALAGGWFAGKSWAGARKLTTLHVINAFTDLGQPTFCKGAIVAQNYGLAKAVNIPHMMESFEECGLPYKYHPDPSNMRFVFPDLGTKNRPSEIFIRSGESPETINGFTIAHGWGDETPRWTESKEDPTRDALIQFKGRMRDPNARIMQMNLTFTHEGDETRVYEEFEQEPTSEHALYRAGSFENPAAKQHVDSMRNQLSADLVEQYITGHAASFRGSPVYPSFIESDNVRAVTLNDDLPLHLSMDFNITPGMNGMVGQIDDRTGIAVAYKEFHHHRMSAIQMFDAFKSWIATSGGFRWPELHIFGDPAGSKTNEATGDTTWEVVKEWIRENMPDVPVRYRYKAGHSPVSARVATVNCALRTIGGKIRYYIDPSCKILIRDFKSMRWAGNELDKDDKKISHMSDAEGYRIELIMPIRKPEMRPLRVGVA